MHVSARSDALPAGKQQPANGSGKMVGVGAALPLYVMLGLTTALFGVQLALSHVTHALTLLVDAYHMLCNLIALTGCIITIKKGLGGGSPPIRSNRGNPSKAQDNSTELSTLREGGGSAADHRLRNTFGWARIDVLVSLIGTVFLASLCFSLLVEAIQTLLHIDHHDEMHKPLYVAGAGAASLAVNVLCYVLLGGYTFHQGSFFHVTENGDVVLEPAVTQNSVKLGERRLSAQRRLPPRTSHQFRQRQGCREMLRDTVGCVFVIAASLTVFFTDESVGKYADPIMSIVSAVLLLILSYPYMKEAGLILLQTIPEHINIKQLRADFQDAFPDVEDIHDLHVWRLNQSRVFCTAHVRFRNSRDYLRLNQDVLRFFLENGVTQVTVQPEFSMDSGVEAKNQVCLMRCPGESCLRAHCCAPNPQHYVRVASDLSLPDAPAKPCDGHGHGHGHGHAHGHGHGHAHSRAHAKQPSRPAPAPTGHVDVVVQVNTSSATPDAAVAYSAAAGEPGALASSGAPVPPGDCAVVGLQASHAAEAPAPTPVANGATQVYPEDDSKSKHD